MLFHLVCYVHSDKFHVWVLYNRISGPMKYVCNISTKIYHFQYQFMASKVSDI